ncbi:MAG: M50 family metallopeptidase [Leptospiraceae bacterium]|nr:M50 family metallopeptidase [Leptospiraceae bacterium]
MISQLKLLEQSYRNYYLKIALLTSLFLTFVSAWDLGFMRFWKNFVVLHHEFFHAYTILVSGGEIYNLTLTENEFGEVSGKIGFRYAIPLIYLSGYVGCIFLGIFLLHESFHYKKSKTILGLFSIYTTFSVLLFTKPFSYSMHLGLAWSVVLLFLSVLQNSFISSLTLHFLGIGISLYAFLDLKDFLSNIAITDLGKLASWILLEFPSLPFTSIELANGLAILILLISLGIVMYYFFKTFQLYSPSEEKEVRKFLLEYKKGNLSEDTANWFLERGLSLDGKKISKDVLKDIYKKGELNE